MRVIVLVVVVGVEASSLRCRKPTNGITYKPATQNPAMPARTTALIPAVTQAALTEKREAASAFVTS